MLIHNKEETRNYFFLVWDKYINKRPLEPIEALIAGVIHEHPEYHHYFNDKQNTIKNDFSPEQNQTNPFLHMGMHIAIKEQIQADRPSGIKQIFKQLTTKSVSIHDTEHRMMECLGHSLWQAQRNKSLPDEIAYLECLKKI